METGHDRHTLRKICKKLTPVCVVKGSPRWKLEDVEAALEANPTTSRALLEERLRGERLDNDRKAREEAEAQRELVKVDEVLTIWGKALLTIRQRIAALPHEAAAQCNPTDPKHALAALQEWADAANRQITQNLPQISGAADDEEVQV